MLPFLLVGFVLLAMWLFSKGAAFGPLRDPVHAEHKAFVEHVEAIGRQYAACGISGVTHSAQSLARFLVMRNRSRVRGGDASWSVLAHELAEKHDLPEEDVRAALRLGLEGHSELGTPAPTDPVPSSHRMLQTLSVLLSGRRVKDPRPSTPGRSDGSRRT